MNINGIIIGAAVFLSIGICHPLVIKMEYYLGKRSWWIWLVAGLAFCVLSHYHRRFRLLLPVGHPRDVPSGKTRSQRLVP